MINFYDYIKTNQLFLKLSENDLMMVEYNCPITESVQSIWSKHNYIAYVRTGKKTWCDNGYEVPVEEGQAILVRKGVTQVIQDFSADVCVLLIFFSDDYALQYGINTTGPNISEKDDLNNFNLCLIRPDNLLEAFFHSVASLLTASDKPSENILRLKFTELILILSQYKQYNQAWRLLTLWAGEKQMRPMMEQLVFESMQLEDYADAFNMSVSTFKRKFAAEFGTTPMKWIRDQRIMRAAQLLINSDKTIQEILFETGFSDPSHFNKTFKRFYHTNPFDYRKNKRA